MAAPHRASPLIQRVGFLVRQGGGACSALLAAIGVGALVGCAGPAPQVGQSTDRTCGLTVWHEPSSPSAYVELVGSWNDFSRPGIPLEWVPGTSLRAARVSPPTGTYRYAIVDDGRWVPDAFTATTGYHGEVETSLRTVDDCSLPMLSLLSVDDDRGEARVRFHPSVSREAKASGKWSITKPDGTAHGDVAILPAEAAGDWVVRVEPQATKVTLDLVAEDALGQLTPPLRVSLWRGNLARDPRDLAIYQIMVDRYASREGAALPTPAWAAGRAGGHLEGVRLALDSIRNVGFNAVWLSPLYENPSASYPGPRDVPLFAYHGYWPQAARALDSHWATEADVDRLVADAHSRGMHIIFDVVPNHVHQDHPYFAEHASGGWFNRTDAQCLCGSSQCPWSSHIGTCWFAPYLPDLNWKNEATARAVTADTLWWLERFDADGLRVDAVPMMPRSAVRRIAAAVRARVGSPGARPYLVGENFTGPLGHDSLSYALGPESLDGAFHFPLLWALRASLGEGRPMYEILDTMSRGESTWGALGSVMAVTIGNHDVPRFITAVGGSTGDGLVPAPQPQSPTLYDATRIALGLVFTLPGVPTVYYGDDIALAGNGDPDSRRVMPSEETWTPDQRATRQFLAAVAALRQCSVALRRGAFAPVATGLDHIVFSRTDASETVLVAARRPSASPLTVELPQSRSGEYVDGLSGNLVTLPHALTIPENRPFLVLLPLGSPCAPATP